MKENEEDTKNGKISCACGSEESILLKFPCSQSNLQIHCSPMKIPMAFSQEIE